MSAPESQSIVESSEAKPLGRTPNSILNGFFIQNEPAFRRLVAIKEKGWNDTRGDDYFVRQRRVADGAKDKDALRFFNMMKEIGDEMQGHTRCLSQPSNCEGDMNILDICMAPGGYTASALKYNPGAPAFGISLPLEQGGHKVLLPRSNSTMLFLDVTMLAKEYGVDTIPLTHPDRSSFRDERPFWGQTFQLIFCDGQKLRTHKRPEYREDHEGCRLAVSQMILALQRIRPGGTIIMLLHKIEAWDTLEVLHCFSGFSSVQVFKPVKKHAIRSSFYLVASGVQPHSDAAKLAVKGWKQTWWDATFGGENGAGYRDSTFNEDHIRLVLDQFGSKFVELARPIWEIQENALSSWKP